MRTSMIALAAACVVAVVGVASPAVGQSGDKYKKQVKEYSQQLDALSDQDQWGVSKEDRSRARKWLKAARERLARGDAKSAEWLLTRTDEMIELIQFTVQTKQLEADADEQEKTYHKMKEERVPELESEVEQLRQQKEKLQQELNSLQ
ncbi:MAG: hypothetical protein ABEN55_24305 [Bradymonadaceae bacterium]